LETTYNVLLISEKINNISDSDIKTLLDYFLMESLSPLYNTLFFKNRIGYFIRKQYLLGKNKISGSSKESFTNGILSIVNSFDISSINQQILDLSIDKEYLQEIVYDFLDSTSYAEDSVINDTPLAVTDLEDINIDILINIRQRVAYWFNLYLELKHKIMARYYQYAHSFVVYYASMCNNNISNECLFDNLIIAIDKALNKYDTSKGALISYIRLWFKSLVKSPIYNFEDRTPFKSMDMKKTDITKCISVDSDEYLANEIKSESLVPEIDFSYTDKDLLDFINSVENINLDIVKIILNIPKHDKCVN